MFPFCPLFSENTVWYKHLRGGVEFVDNIPKTASGKILHRLLKDKFEVDE